MKRRTFVLIALVILLTGVLACQELGDLPTFPPEIGPTGSPAVTTAPGGIPFLEVKPEPQEITFGTCPPGGNGGDLLQNLLKNRIDEAQSYYPVDFQSVLDLTWPSSIEREDRMNWTTGETDAISRYEGTPISVEGYLTAPTESGRESTNCNETDNAGVDWHVPLVPSPGQDRSLAIVTETTPRVRPNHSWTLAKLRDIAESKQRVRISGWLFFDPEHPDHIGKYRATLWEIHPVMEIEVLLNGVWIPLDEVP
jgi:hypothetical protein